MPTVHSVYHGRLVGAASAGRMGPRRGWTCERVGDSVARPGDAESTPCAVPRARLAIHGGCARARVGVIAPHVVIVRLRPRHNGVPDSQRVVEGPRRRGAQRKQEKPSAHPPERQGHHGREFPCNYQAGDARHHAQQPNSPPTTQLAYPQCTRGSAWGVNQNGCSKRSSVHTSTGSALTFSALRKHTHTQNKNTRSPLKKQEERNHSRHTTGKTRI